MIILNQVNKFNLGLKMNMAVHYSQPKSFVGRSICYEVFYGNVLYGHIVAGSAVKFLAGRDEFLGFPAKEKLNQIINNIFYHIKPTGGRYPVRNFTSRVLLEFERVAATDWLLKYGDRPLAFESLVELPRSGETYRRAGYTEVGMTKGYTCKRTGGKGTDSWTGKRVWDTQNLRPKRIFIKKFDNTACQTNALPMAA